MGRHRRKNRAAVPVRTGLLAAVAAVAVATVAAATGVVPGGKEFLLGENSSSSKQLQLRESETGLSATYSKASPGPARPQPKAPEAGKPAAPQKSAAPKATPRPTAPAKPDATAKPDAAAKPEQPHKAVPQQRAPRTAAPQESTARKAAPQQHPKNVTSAPARALVPEPATSPESPAPGVSAETSAAVTGEAAAEAEVLTLVNEERAKVGCSPLRVDGSLGALAGRFSEDMAARGFFGHVDPEGNDPWKRAARLGVGNLGAENIARGPGDAETVVRHWMSDDAQRAQLLNCDYRTMGVGVSFADGGPWWAQDLGF
ncbi:CAP domain-containing protein [Streptomyces sp. NPDC059828]|uniref:CAP domain-containing protein n=1 Tax=Streptomyces sp. NPDC059828 TaxID=3346965 RepID=UPI00364D4716